MEKLNQNNESSQNFKAEPKLPQIETVHLTTFEELHYYTVQDVFLILILEVKIPITDEYSWFYTCRFLNPECVEKYYTACCRMEDLDEFAVQDYKLQLSLILVILTLFSTKLLTQLLKVCIID